MAKGRRIEENSLKRVLAETRSSEYRPTDHRRKPPEFGDAASTARFVLLEPLEYGRAARALRLTTFAREGQGEKHQSSFIGGSSDQIVIGGAGLYNYLPAMAQVTAKLNGGVWVADMNDMWVVPPQTVTHPYPCLYVSGVQAYDEQKDMANTTAPSGWEGDFMFGMDYNEDSQYADTLPNQKELITRPIPACQVNGPTKAAYYPWDGTFPDGSTVPQSIVTALGFSSYPSSDELWGPHASAKLSRSITVLELFWWEFCPPDWECVPAATSGDADVWGVICDNNTVARSAIACTDPKPDSNSAFFRSPVGWWNLAGWNWAWWWNVGWWTYPNGWWNGGYSNWNDNYWWGPFGYGWWRTYFGGGGLPPTSDDILELEAGDVPTPPCGGGVTKRNRYGFIVWETGWRVIGGVDTSAETCLIIGPLKHKAPTLVVENPDPPDTICTSY